MGTKEAVRNTCECDLSFYYKIRHDEHMSDENNIIDCEMVDEAKDILGEKFSVLVDRYINDTKVILSTMDVDRAAGQHEKVAEGAHSLKSSSYQVGAKLVSIKASEIETYVRSHVEELVDITLQKNIETLISELQNNFFDYQNKIKSYL